MRSWEIMVKIVELMGRPSEITGDRKHLGLKRSDGLRRGRSWGDHMGDHGRSWEIAPRLEESDGL